MYKRVKIGLRCIVCVMLGLLCGCSSADEQTGRDDESVNSLSSLLSELSRTKNTDSLLRITTPLFYAAPETVDSMVRLCAAVYNAQEYIAIDCIDSAKLYIDYLMQREKTVASVHKLGGMMYMSAAFYDLKSARDLSGSIDLLIKSYECFKADGDRYNSIIALVNIVQFFYFRSDIQGLEYAEIAYEESHSMQDSDYYRCVAAMSMAQMLSLSDHPEEADRYIYETDSLIAVGGYHSIYYMVQLLYASRFEDEGKHSQADSCYSAVLTWLQEQGNDPSGIQQVCLEWGKYCLDTGRYNEAMRLFEEGIRVSEETGSNVILDKLLLNMSVSAMRAGQEQESMYYYKRYLAIQDSLSIVKSEQDFNELYQRYRKAKQDLDIMAKDMALIESRRKATIVVFMLISVIAILMSVLVVWYRQRKMYRMLVLQYQNYLKNVEAARIEAADDVENDTEYQLWQKIENMMSGQKIFCRKDLSLDVLAEEAGTNRTYLSKTINRFSHGDFYTYLNKYRVKEAIDIIKTSEQSVPFKQIADQVGYNSLQIFYKVFVKETGLPPGKYRTELQRLSKESQDMNYGSVAFQQG